MNQAAVQLQGAAWKSAVPASSPCSSCQRSANGLETQSSSWKNRTFQRIAETPKQPPNQKHQRNLAALQKMFAGFLWESAVSQQHAEELFTYFDDLWFCGELSGRCHLVVEHPGAMERRRRGVTSVIHRCEKHKQILNVKITINPDEPEPGFTGFRLLQYAGTLLHEMCHASILLFVDCGSFSPFESIIYLGMEGHGTLFDMLFRSMAGIFTWSTGWTISLDAHLYYSVCQDLRRRAEAAYLWTQTSYHLPESARNYAGLKQFLNLTEDESERLVQLIIDGRDVLEIIVILRFDMWDGYWRLPTWDVTQFIEAAGDPYSVIVEGLSETTVTPDALAHCMWLLPLPLHPPLPPPRPTLPPPLHPSLLPPPPPLNPTLSRKRSLKRAPIPTARSGTKRGRTET